MFDTAYLSIIGDPQIESCRNCFTVNGSASHRIFCGPNLYKITSGTNTVIITAENGEAWEVTADVGYKDLLTIKPTLAGSAIVDVGYKVSAAPAGIGFAANRKP